MRLPRLTRKLWRLIAILGTGAVIVLCFMPGRHVPAPSVIGLDKFFHALAFFAVAYAWHRSGLAAGHVLLLGLLLAAGTEIGQAILDGLGTTENPIPVVASRSTIAIDGRGNANVMERDPNGRTKKHIDPLGRVFTYGYTDEHLTSVTFPSAAREAYAFDDYGNVTSLSAYDSTDTLYATYAYEYSAEDDQLVMVTNPEGGETQFEYDSSGALARVIGPEGGVHEFTYEDPLFPELSHARALLAEMSATPRA